MDFDALRELQLAVLITHALKHMILMQATPFVELIKRIL